ncbi:hypothetical protein FQN60_014401 [Etheostoma spectabile]|uniref:Uncharacterized protein n=1 Tax=Etheostoma spectabile TaxID=54343 RepID=A0A5J5D8P9_9PERO|nr:hypothetical protein FQN60_014401 [Etheostoma spectabile]
MNIHPSNLQTGSHGGPNERGALSCQGFSSSGEGGGKIEIQKQRLKGALWSSSVQQQPDNCFCL